MALHDSFATPGPSDSGFGAFVIRLRFRCTCYLTPVSVYLLSDSGLFVI